MEATLIPQIKEDWTYKYLVQQAESCKASKQHIAVPTTTTRTPRPTSTKAHNPDHVTGVLCTRILTRSYGANCGRIYKSR